MPWSLMVFQQRNGRVDRYGQKHQPKIVYLFTEAATDKIRGDLRILEILEKKDEQATSNLGDPSAFLNVFDADKESEKVAAFMADGLTPEQVEITMDATAASDDDNEADSMMKLFGASWLGSAEPADAAPTGSAGVSAAGHTGNSLSHITEPVSLFKTDYQYAQTALKQINQPEILCQWTAHDAEQIIAITAPADLQDRLRQLPREAQAANDHYSLCADPARMAASIETARQAKAEDDTWPKLHYLWPQHPVLEWLGDRVLNHFPRHSAPVVQNHKLHPCEQAFVLMSLVPNCKGQPLLVEWQVACRIGNAGAFTLEPFATFSQRAGLQSGGLPNRGTSEALAATTQVLQAALPDAVANMRTHMLQLQGDFAAQSSLRLRDTLQNLEQLQKRQIVQLELRLESQIETVKRSRFEHRSRQIGRVFDDYREWVKDTLTTEPQPWIQVLAALCNPDNKSA
jgi:hypothetical protein